MNACESNASSFICEMDTSEPTTSNNLATDEINSGKNCINGRKIVESTEFVSMEVVENYNKYNSSSKNPVLKSILNSIIETTTNENVEINEVGTGSMEPELVPIAEREIDEENCNHQDIEDEIIEIDEDEDIEIDFQSKSNDEKIVRTNYGKECLNIKCTSNTKILLNAPNFVINFFQISNKLKNQYVCEDCYNTSLSAYEKFNSTLKVYKSIVKENIPERQEIVEILDSSDEEEEKTDEEDGLLELVDPELEFAIKNIIENLEMQKQVELMKESLKNELMVVESGGAISDEMLKELQQKCEKLYGTIFQSRSKTRELSPLDISCEQTVTENEIDDETLHAIGEFSHSAIEPNKTYFAVKNNLIDSWAPCSVLESVIDSNQVVKYKVQFANSSIEKFVLPKHMAYSKCPNTNLQIGARVIAVFDSSLLSETSRGMKNAFYPGVVAEALQPYNNDRYLIFFDDGYSQYVYHKDVRLVCSVSENVWEDVHISSREFIRDFLTNKKNRAMVQVKRGQGMLTESNGKWINAKVIDVDSSLVRMQFSNKNHTEWIYRGSTRLSPIYKERQSNTTQNNQIHRRTEPYIQYVRNEDENKVETNLVENVPRAVAKKSSSKPSSTESVQPTVKRLNNSTIFLEDGGKPKGKVVFYTSKKSASPRPFISHECSPKCLFREEYDLKNYSPLSKPLLSGWERRIYEIKLKKWIVYKSPCGRNLRNMKELHRYLRITKNNLNVDNFTFEAEINCLAEYVIESCIVQNLDLSNGVENMIIPCVNYYDNTMPVKSNYSTIRIPTEGVHLNLDPEFLVGCDCTDDCSDKSKCSCWQLTLAGAKYGRGKELEKYITENTGYSYKRLLNPVTTGIYECNIRCKCSKNCLNRVVQHPLSMKLQVFKTSNRGWGLRCINDIPIGSFVCIYTGHLLTEEKANEGGTNSGDEYFAELDYIEVVERYKEGYESEIPGESDDENEEELNVTNDSDEEYRLNTKITSAAHTRHTRLQSKKIYEEDDGQRIRKILNFEANVSMDNVEDMSAQYKSTRELFGKDEYCYVMDAKTTGNIGRYFNHSCSPNLFVQNVFVDTHDLRFPWVAFFAAQNIRAGTELTWNYNYEVGVVPGKVLYCECGADQCKKRLL